MTGVRHLGCASGSVEGTTPLPNLRPPGDVFVDEPARALAADAPLIGLKIYEAAGMKARMEPANSPVRFGHWACRHLVNRGARDETFVSRGRDMLTANLLPRFYEGGDSIQAALWLKAIYFDSGVVQTPEQAFAKAYDSMPGVRRPDFMEV